MSRALARVAALVGALCVAPHATADEPVDVTFGLSVVVAREDGERVVDDAWMAAQIAEANRLFSPNGVRFRWTIEKPLPDRLRELHSRDDRDALVEHVEPQAIDVFVVSALEDVDEPGRYRMGVCWTERNHRGRYVVVAKHARPTVLAHELGHLFGNPHSDQTDNVMSYSRTGAAVFLDDAQSARIRRFARNFLTTGRFADVGPPLRRRP